MKLIEQRKVHALVAGPDRTRICSDFGCASRMSDATLAPTERPNETKVGSAKSSSATVTTAHVDGSGPSVRLEQPQHFLGSSKTVLQLLRKKKSEVLNRLPPTSTLCTRRSNRCPSTTRRTDGSNDGPHLTFSPEEWVYS